MAEQMYDPIPQSSTPTTSEPMFDPINPPLESAPPSRPDNLPLQSLAGVAITPTRLAGMAADVVGNPLGVEQLGTSDDAPAQAIAFNNYIAQKYGPPDPNQPNGWDSATRAKAWQEFSQANGNPVPKTANESAGTLLQKGLSAAHLNPEDYFPAPQSPAERVARAMGEGAASMLVPVEGEINATRMLGNIGIGALSGGGGQVASELAPDEYKPLANLTGALVTGGVGALGMEGIKLAGKEAATAYTGLPDRILGIPTGSKTLAEKAAANYVQNAASNPAQLRQSLETMPAETGVPGFKPNLYQATDDNGIGVLSGVIDRAFPEAYKDRVNAQAQAWHDALANAQPDGQPLAAADVVRQQMNELDTLTGAQQERALAQVNQSLGPDVPAADAAGQVRNAMQSVSDARDDRIGNMYKTLDPSGTMQVVSGPLKRASAGVYDNLPAETQSSLSPYENEVQQTINGYGPMLPLRNLMALKSRISQEMMAANSPLNPNRAAAGRLAQLRGAVENAIDDTISGQVANDQAAVSAGQKAPEDTLYARLLADRQNWLANRDVEGTVARSDIGAGAGPDAASGPTVVPSTSGTKGAPGSGLPSPPSGPAVPEEQPPRLDAATARQLRTATAATKELRTQQSAAPVAAIMQREGATFPYKMSPGTASTNMWKSGPKGADAIRNIAALGQNHPDIAEGLSNLADNSLRAETAKSGLTPDALAAWRAKYAPALDELERLSPGTQARYDTVAHATDGLAEARRIREDAVGAYEKSVLGKFIGARDENEVTNHVATILGSATSVRDMRALVNEVGYDPDALSGLRKAAVDAISRRAVSAVETTKTGDAALTVGNFNRFIAKAEPALREVLTPEQIGTLRAISQTMRQATKTMNIPGQSVTHQAKEAAARFKEVSPSERGTFIGNILGRTVRDRSGRAGGLGMLGAVASVFRPEVAGTLFGAAGVELYAALRQAGMSNINDVIRKMIANPEFARDMLRKVPLRENAGAWMPLKQSLKRLAMVSPVIASQQQTNQNRAASAQKQ